MTLLSCLLPLRVLCLLQQNNNCNFHYNPVTGNMLHTLPTTDRGCFSYLVLDPNMTHCLRQQPLAQTERTPHLQKPELPGSSLSPFFQFASPVHTSKPTRGSRCLAAARNSEWFPVVWSNHTPRNSFHSRIVLPLQGTCCWYAEVNRHTFRLAQSLSDRSTLYWTYRLG